MFFHCLQSNSNFKKGHQSTNNILSQYIKVSHFFSPEKYNPLLDEIKVETWQTYRGITQTKGKYPKPG
jgi:hypothetical protein